MSGNIFQNMELSSSSEDCSSDEEISKIVDKMSNSMKKKIGQRNNRNYLNKNSVMFVVDKRPGNIPFPSTENSENKLNSFTRVSDDIDIRSRNKDDKRMTNNIEKLSSTIQSSVKLSEPNAYKKHKVEMKKPKVKEENVAERLSSSKNSAVEELMKKSILTPDFEKKDSLEPYQESLRKMKKKRREERAKDKGKGWYGMSAPEMTDEVKMNLQVLQMRRSLDPKRFYKANDIKTLPKYFQFGTVVESPADFYHSRVPKKQRKSDLVQELMADAEFRKYNKRKYVEIQEAKMKGTGPYKRMKRLKKKKR